VRVAGLGLLFFCLFPILFNASASFTTAARAAMALSTLPLLTLLIGAMLGVEPLTWRKGIGVLVAMAGVSIALISGLSSAPAGAWRGDLLMAGAALCMALYSIWSKPIIQRSGAITFTTGAMAAGAVALFLLSALTGGLYTIQHFNGAQWDAVLYLGIFGAAVSFFFWSLALRRTTPTRVTVSMTVNPILAASVGAVLLGEPIGWPIIAGLLSVAAGIWITVTSR
jgi:drug/metabolite transporter (DMT)-like permease